MAILNSLKTHNFPIFEPILMIRLSIFMLHRDLSDKTYLSLGLLSPLIQILMIVENIFKIFIEIYCDDYLIKKLVFI